jgi:hypothetical protein
LSAAPPSSFAARLRYGVAVRQTLRGNKRLAGALSAITAAVVGVIINLSIWFALHTLFLDTLRVRRFGLSFDRPVLSSVDIAALVLASAAATAIFRFKAGMLAVLGGSCAAGLALRLAGLIRGKFALPAARYTTSAGASLQASPLVSICRVAW